MGGGRGVTARWVGSVLGILKKSTGEIFCWVLQTFLVFSILISQIVRIFVISLLFFFVTWPREPISNGRQSANHPSVLRSLLRSKYLVNFLMFAPSIFFLQSLLSTLVVLISYFFLLIITISGYWLVVMMSAGIVPPFIVSPGISVYIVTSSGFTLLISLVIWWSTELWHH